MRLSTKVASAVGAVGLAATGALAAFTSSPAVAHVPAVVRLSATNPSQVTPTAPTGPTVDTPAAEVPGAEAPGAEAPETAAEATTPEPANEPQVPGGGHADASGTTADHQFDGVE